ncbi:MAG: hydroxymethylglutaryl-CoA lyase [Mycobacterium sp.]
MDSTAIITEVSLRDGLQIEPVTVPTADKLRLGSALIDAGFTNLEVGAFVNPAKVPTMADSEDVMRGLDGSSAALHALVFNLRGAHRAVSCGTTHVRFVVSASDGHSLANAGATTLEAMDRIEEAANWLADQQVSTEATIATAFVCPFDGDTPIERVLTVAQRFIDCGIGVLHLADTIGAATPGDIRRTVSAVQKSFPETELGLHLHNTYGMASASVWEALELGVRRFDAALGGLGGCPFAPGAAGNIAADDLVHLLHREGIQTGIDTERLTAARDLLRGIVGHPLHSSLAAVGTAPAELRTSLVPSL